MSGAEALAAIGLASNALQFVDFAARLCARISEYSSTAAGPRTLAMQVDRLDSLIGVLDGLAKRGGQPLKAQILLRCQEQAEELECLLDDLKGEGRSRLVRAKKAWRSLRHEEKLQELQKVLDSLVNVLSLQLHAEVVANTQSIRQLQDEQGVVLENISRLSQFRLENDEEKSASSPSKPLWLIPIGRNDQFVGRDAILEELDHRLMIDNNKVPIAVLCGLGGVG